MIILPSRKFFEPNREIIVPRGALCGRFKIEAIRPDGRRRLLADWFGNLITDLGLDAIGNGNYLPTCCVGTGNNAPANGNTALQALVGSTTNVISQTQGAQSSPPYYGTYTGTYRFAVGVATGNLAEVGIGSTATNLFSRALILDGSSNPTTITVLSSEALDVTYQLQNHAPTTDVTGSLVISGTSYNYTIRASRATNAGIWGNFSPGEPAGVFNIFAYNGAISADATGSPTGANAPITIANSAYSAGSHQLNFTGFADLTVANLSGGITAFECLCGRNSERMGSFQVGLSAAIPKDGSHTLTMAFRQTWARFP